MIRIDLETFSECDLREAGAWRYAEDPSTEILCFAYRIHSEKVKTWRQGEKFPLDLSYEIKTEKLIWAYNANFERALWECVGARIGFPSVKADQWRCSQALAAMCAFPILGGLGEVAAALKCAEQKDKEGQRLIRLFSIPKKPTKKDPRTRILPRDEPEEFNKFVQYCIQDVKTENAVHDALPMKELGAYEQKVWLIDSNINRRGVLVDTKLATGALNIQKDMETRELARLGTITNGKITTANQGARIIEFCAGHGCLMKSLAKDGVAELLKGKLPKVVRQVLRIRQLLARSTVSKYQRALVCASPGSGRVRGLHQYHVATTGRWAGRLLQGQNLARPLEDVSGDIDLIHTGDLGIIEIFYPDPIGVLRDAIRHIFIAPPGKVLNIADLAAIEARVLGWLAEEMGYLNAFINNQDLYVLFAMVVYACEMAEVEKPRRFIGKECILQLGYQAGLKSFLAYLQRKPGLKDIDPDLVERAHTAYRETYKKIVKFWGDAQRCAMGAITLRQPMHLRPTPKSVSRLAFEMIGKHLTIKLPSGRRLWYPDADVRMVTTPWGEMVLGITYMAWIKEKGKGEFWGRTKTYGGQLTENIVQAVSRDILAESLITCEESGHPVVVHVHDEIVTETEKDTHKQLIKIFATAPKWADGLPLKAEGFSSTFYRKD